MKRIVLGIAASVASLAAPAADTRMQPGLYDYTAKMEIPGMPFPMPPQKFQHCLTQADVDSGKQFESQQNQDCEVKNLKQSGNSASFDLACKDGTTGSASYTFTGDSFSGKTVMTKEGHPMTINLSAVRSGACR